jgi:hypothetical protein
VDWSSHQVQDSWATVTIHTTLKALSGDKKGREFSRRTLGLEVIILVEEAGEVLLGARRREGAGHTEEHHALALKELRARVLLKDAGRKAGQIVFASSLRGPLCQARRGMAEKRP